MSTSDSSSEAEGDSDQSESNEMVGYRQQPGKLPFSKPGSGGKNRFSEPTDQSMIPESEGRRSRPTMGLTPTRWPG